MSLIIDIKKEIQNVSIQIGSRLPNIEVVQNIGCIKDASTEFYQILFLPKLCQKYILKLTLLLALRMLISLICCKTTVHLTYEISTATAEKQWAILMWKVKGAIQSPKVS